jgi:hypothetical protein
MVNRFVDWRLKSWFVKKSVKTIHKHFVTILLLVKSK